MKKIVMLFVAVMAPLILVAQGFQGFHVETITIPKYEQPGTVTYGFDDNEKVVLELHYPAKFESSPCVSGFTGSLSDRFFGILNNQADVSTSVKMLSANFQNANWAELDKWVQAWTRRSDTLYVVLGIVPGSGYPLMTLRSDKNIFSTCYNKQNPYNSFKIKTIVK